MESIYWSIRSDANNNNNKYPLPLPFPFKYLCSSFQPFFPPFPNSIIQWFSQMFPRLRNALQRLSFLRQFRSEQPHLMSNHCRAAWVSKQPNNHNHNHNQSPYFDALTCHFPHMAPGRPGNPIPKPFFQSSMRPFAIARNPLAISSFYLIKNLLIDEGLKTKVANSAIPRPRSNACWPGVCGSIKLATWNACLLFWDWVVFWPIYVEVANAILMLFNGLWLARSFAIRYAIRMMCL